MPFGEFSSESQAQSNTFGDSHSTRKLTELRSPSFVLSIAVSFTTILYDRSTNLSKLHWHLIKVRVLENRRCITALATLFTLDFCLAICQFIRLVKAMFAPATVSMNISTLALHARLTIDCMFSRQTFDLSLTTVKIAPGFPISTLSCGPDWSHLTFSDLAFGIQKLHVSFVAGLLCLARVCSNRVWWR